MRGDIARQQSGKQSYTAFCLGKQSYTAIRLGKQSYTAQECSSSAGGRATPPTRALFALGSTATPHFRSESRTRTSSSLREFCCWTYCFKSKGTVRSYESTLPPLLQQYGRSPVDSLDRQQLEQYFNNLNRLSYTTHNRHQTIIQSLLNFVLEQGYISSNPIARLKRHKPDWEKGEHGSDEVILYLTPGQLETLYNLLEPNSRLHNLVLLLHHTGTRVGEVLVLDLADIDRVNYKFRVLGKGNKQR